ncbi:MAG: hypothetical protein HOV81_22650 [Kofleriaceae bacterium]|nr:hypothetical protein [Kofleriaceae bacterium]
MRQVAVTIIGACVLFAGANANADEDTSVLNNIQIPAAAPGVDTAKLTAPTWCGVVKPEEYRARGFEGLFRDRYFGVSSYGMAARIICQWPKDPAAGHAARALVQLYMNESGLSEARATELLALRAQEDLMSSGQKTLCSALAVSDEVGGEEKQFAKARKELFGCPSSTPAWIEPRPKTLSWDTLTPYLDSSVDEPDVLVRTASVFNRSAGSLFASSAPEPKDALLGYIADQIDYKAITEAAALKLLDQAPYKGNAYARLVALESVAKARLAAFRIGVLVEQKIKDEAWKELLVTAPQRGIENFEKAVAQWKGQIARSAAFEKTFWGPSRKAMQGCWATLRKDFLDVMKTMKHANENEAYESLNEPVPALLFGRLAACAQVEQDAAYARELGDLTNKVRYARGPRTAAYYAAVAALGDILADRAKFPVEARDLKGLQAKGELSDAASHLPDKEKSKVDRFNFDDGEATVKSVKKRGDDVEVSFVTTKEKIMSTSCTPTNRIMMFRSDGAPVYYDNCKNTGLVTVDSTPDPILVDAGLAEGIKPGMVVKFKAAEPRNRYALPVAVYADKKKTKLVSYYGLAF